MGNARIKRDEGKQGNGNARDAAPKVVLVGTYKGDQLRVWRGWYCWPIAADEAMHNAQCSMLNEDGANGENKHADLLTPNGVREDVSRVNGEQIRVLKQINELWLFQGMAQKAYKANIEATTKLREAAGLLDVPLIDHIILGNTPSAFVSLAECLTA